MSRCEWCGAWSRGTAVQTEPPYAVRISCGKHGLDFVEEHERRFDPVGTLVFIGLCVAGVVSLVFLPALIGIWIILVAVGLLGRFVMWGLGSTAYVRRRRR